jgi:transcriptional regulator with XRE-family HTH domain
MMEYTSIMKEPTKSHNNSDLNLSDRIAERIRTLRAARGLSLESLAVYCGVSRSMISLIERGESSPTAVLLEKLATGLDVTLASLFDAPQPDASPISRAADQVEWRDPQSGYLRRNVSPSGFASPIQIVAVSFPAGARVAYETGARTHQVHQQVWIQEGSIEITIGKVTHRLRAGDCIAMQLDQPIIYHNPTRKMARHLVVISS